MTHLLNRRSILVWPLAVSLLTPALCAQTKRHFPPAGAWEHKTPAAMGMDAAKLKEAIAWAESHGSKWDFAKDQVRVFGKTLGPLPVQRAATNGVVLRHGYIVAEFGDTKTNDPVYSIAKSFVSTTASIAFAKGLIRNVDDKVAAYVQDGGYDSAHNAKITWTNHLQQESEWEGVMWGKNANFLGVEEFGEGRMTPRDIREPGIYYEYNDARLNRFSLSLARVFGTGLPAVLKESIMDPIGASHEWAWHGYGSKSTTEINGKPVESVSGGTRWGGGLWINSQDLARFGLLILNKGNWNGKQLVSEKWIKDATTPSAHGPDYGYLWWLNTTRQHWPSGPAASFAAIGAGGNIIWIDPEHDIVLVWHWHAPGESVDGMIQRILASLKAS
ncbi:MAG: class C beta-lactamase-related serine hydrolase [Bryobacterales bacterium]|nr:class C beta-lactamase-related serine hydrolase [Bryobacterales bacterium]